MGLDMYLFANRHVWNFDEGVGARLSSEVGKILGLSNDIQLVQLRFEIGYWRKANHIHRWFVKNIQQDKDDCGFYDVYEHNLLSLKNDCEKVLADRDLASKILPTQAGFFFGSKDYDEWYYNSLKDTIEIIDRALELGNQFLFQYHSSW